MVSTRILGGCKTLIASSPDSGFNFRSFGWSHGLNQPGVPKGALSGDLTIDTGCERAGGESGEDLRRSPVEDTEPELRLFPWRKQDIWR
jgi:hypothetical protein